jgi:S1-C subfamily serine protease
MEKDDDIFFMPYPVPVAMGYIDPRTNSSNTNVDLALLIVPAKSTPQIPYQVPVARWGDSGRLGVGDEIVIGGFPFGKSMFLAAKSNRGFVQPTFLSGIVSAILPATKPTETRILQLSIATAGGMSGGAVFDPKTGEVLGMVTAGLNLKDGDKPVQPVTYALPSEIIAPFVDALTFETQQS